jgi:hypothetical protein
VDPFEPQSTGACGEAEPRGSDHQAGVGASRSPLIFCGLCGALNPSTNHFCAACGTTLVDAFHATEGLRVFERPDPAARLIEIVPSGRELDVVEDPTAPADYVRVRLQHGRLGYVRLADVAALEAGGVIAASGPLGPAGRAPDINTNARGCVSSSAAIGALALLLVTITLGLILLALSDDADTSLFAALFCVVVVPFMLLTIGFYLYARSREERLAEEEAEELAATRTVADSAGEGASG